MSRSRLKEQIPVRHLVNLALIRGRGNRGMHAEEIIQFIEQHFTIQLKGSNHWNRELREALQTKRLVSERGVLDLHTYNFLPKQEIHEFYAFITSFMNRYPDPNHTCYGLRPNVSWDSLFPFEIHAALQQYLEDDFEAPTKTPRSDEEERLKQARSRATTPKRIRKSPSDGSGSSALNKYKKNNSGTRSTPTTPARVRRAKTVAPRTPPRAQRILTRSGAREAQNDLPRDAQPEMVVNTSSNFAPQPVAQFSIPPVHLPQLPLAEPYDINDAFDGVDIPQEFFDMSEEIIRDIDGGSGDDQGGVYPRDDSNDVVFNTPAVQNNGDPSREAATSPAGQGFELRRLKTDIPVSEPLSEGTSHLFERPAVYGVNHALQIVDDDDIELIGYVSGGKQFLMKGIAEVECKPPTMNEPYPGSEESTDSKDQDYIPLPSKRNHA